MKKIFSSTPLATLALIALSMVLSAGEAAAAPPAPPNGVVYSCSGGDWNTLKFQLPQRGDLRRGIVYKNNDNRKADLANKNGVWEFTFVNDMQCKAMYSFNRRGQLIFTQCTDGINRFCHR